MISFFFFFLLSIWNKQSFYFDKIISQSINWCEIYKQESYIQLYGNYKFYTDFFLNFIIIYGACFSITCLCDYKLMHVRSTVVELL